MIGAIPYDELPFLHLDLAQLVVVGNESGETGIYSAKFRISSNANTLRISWFAV